MLTKRGLLALVCAGLMSLTMVGPAMADTSGSINAHGTLPITLSMTISNTDIDFGLVALNTCNGATNSTWIGVSSNAHWTMTTQATAGANAPAVTDLYWARAHANPTCGGASPAGTAFTGAWDPFWSGTAVLGTTSTEVTYSLLLGASVPNGGQAFSYTILYSITN